MPAEATAILGIGPMEATTTLLTGALVRLTALGIGAFLCWLGYRLFLDVPVTDTGGAELSGPHGASLRLTRIGPGVFFALFGTATVIWALSQSLEYHGREQRPDGAVVEQTAGAVNPALLLPSGAAAEGATPAGAAPDPDAARLARTKLHQELAWLNRLPHADTEAERRAVRDDAPFLVPRIKLRLMLGAWNRTAWGDPAAFVAWYDRTGGLGRAPPALAAAARMFQAGADLSAAADPGAARAGSSD